MCGGRVAQCQFAPRSRRRSCQIRPVMLRRRGVGRRGRGPFLHISRHFWLVCGRTYSHELLLEPEFIVESGALCIVEPFAQVGAYAVEPSLAALYCACGADLFHFPCTRGRVVSVDIVSGREAEGRRKNGEICKAQEREGIELDVETPRLLVGLSELPLVHMANFSDSSRPLLPP